MRGRDFLAVSSWLACALLALTPLRAQQVDEPPAGDVDVALQEVSRLRTESELDAARLLDASERLRRCVRSRPDEVVSDELELVGSSDPQRSLRAQLLLAQLPRLPHGWRSRLRGDASLAAQVYAALRDRSTEQTAREGDGEAVDDQAVVLLESVATELCAQLSISEEELDGGKPDFAADYRRECAPRLSRPQEFVTADDCTWVDLDGDMARELVVVCDSVWQTFWLHDIAFVAVIHPATRSLQLWRLPHGGRVRSIQALDFDGDGASEVAISVDVMGGRAPVSALMVVSRHGVVSLSAEGPSNDLVVFRVNDRPLIAARAGLDWRFPGGTATERCGALAARHDVFRFDAGKFALVTPVWLPLQRDDE